MRTLHSLVTVIIRQPPRPVPFYFVDFASKSAWYAPFQVLPYFRLNNRPTEFGAQWAIRCRLELLWLFYGCLGPHVHSAPRLTPHLTSVAPRLTSHVATGAALDAVSYRALIDPVAHRALVERPVLERPVLVR